jgi:phosphorylase kinase alpha/beta subunit
VSKFKILTKKYSAKSYTVREAFIKENHYICFYFLSEAEAANVQNWKTVRYCTSILHRTVDSLAPSITGILIRGKILSLGVFGKEEIDITKPLPPATIEAILYEKIFPHNLFCAVLMQELIINISKYMTTNLELFEGIMKLRLSWIVEVMQKELSAFGAEGLDIYSLSPNAVKHVLFYILSCNTSEERFVYFEFI